MDDSKQISPEEFSIYVDLYGSGEKLELGVVPRDLDEVTYMIYVDWAEITCIRYDSSEREQWIQLEGFNMPQNTINLIGQAIEQYYT